MYIKNMHIDMCVNIIFIYIYILYVYMCIYSILDIVQQCLLHTCKYMCI